MKLHRTPNPLDRGTRNSDNTNWAIIEEHINKLSNSVINIKKDMTDEALQELMDSIKLTWDTPVSSYSQLPTNDPEGTTRMTRDDGRIYRFQKGRWVEILQINPALIEELENRLDRQRVDITTFGAKGDGVTIDTPAIQSALDYVRDRGGGEVFAPPGTYRAKGLRVHSNTILRGAGDATVFVPSSTGGYMFILEGEIEETYEFIEDNGRGDSLVELDHHDLDVGDLVMLVSQRDALSDDAGVWRLGTNTPGVTHCHFGEFKKIRSVIDRYKVELSSGLIFPSYRSNNVLENSEYAAKTSVVHKIKPAKNIVLENFRVEGGLSTVVWGRLAYNCMVRDVSWASGQNGNMISWVESYKCVGFRVNVVHDYNTEPTYYYSRNTLKVISSQLCGFRECNVDNGSQPVDFTFKSGGICTSFAYIESSTITNSTHNSATSHGGTYSCKFIDNNMVGCELGISVRSMESIVSHNSIVGSRLDTGYGLTIYDGYAKRCVVDTNVIIGYGTGIEVRDSKDGMFNYVGLTISNNTIRQTNLGIKIRRDADNKYVGLSDILISGNRILQSISNENYSKMVDIDPYVRGVSIINNTMISNTHTNHMIYLRNNVSDIVVKDNHFVGTSKTVRVLDNDGSMLDDGSKPIITYVDNHEVDVWPVRPDKFSIRSQRSGNIYPLTDDIYSLGWSQGRWTTAYLSSSPITTSDMRVKDLVDTIPDKWLDAWADVKYSRYKFKDSIEKKDDKARWHVGVVAQQIYEAFSNHGLDAFEIGLLCYDEWTDESGEKQDIWSVRSDECMYMESALIRRTIDRMINKFEED